MKRHLTRNGVQIGGWFPAELVEAVDKWVSSHPERDRSIFLRESAREKLAKEGIAMNEGAPASN